MANELVDIEREEELRAYLRRTGRVGQDEAIGVKVLAGGVSNKTVWVGRENGEEWVLKQALPKLRVKVDWFSDPSRIAREAEGLRWLNQVIPEKTTPFLFEDRSQYLMAMQAVPQPNRTLKEDLLTEGFDPKGFIREFERKHEFSSILAMIHLRGYEQRQETSNRFADRSFFESLRLEPYYLYTAAQVPEAAEFLKRLVDETRSRLLTVVHGDFSPKNVLVRGDTGRLVLLDHEVIHFGDPAFDLGFVITHLLSKANHRSDELNGSGLVMMAGGIWGTYRSILKDVPWIKDLQQHVVYHTLACLLARVAGRSPLEYLTEEQRQKQRNAALLLMAEPPRRVHDLCEAFERMVREPWR
jgi:5-methylthioribose kinase